MVRQESRRLVQPEHQCDERDVELPDVRVIHQQRLQREEAGRAARVPIALRCARSAGGRLLGHALRDGSGGGPHSGARVGDLSAHEPSAEVGRVERRAERGAVRLAVQQHEQHAKRERHRRVVNAGPQAEQRQVEAQRVHHLVHCRIADIAGRRTCVHRNVSFARGARLATAVLAEPLRVRAGRPEERALQQQPEQLVPEVNPVRGLLIGCVFQ